MSWIKVLAESEADEALAELYRRVRTPDGELDHIMSIHSLHPEGLATHYELYSAVMRPTPTLRKVEREMIALVVSKVNDCHY